MDKQEEHIDQYEPGGAFLLRYIDGIASEEEKRDVEEWLNADTEHEQVLLQTARIYYAYQTRKRIVARDAQSAFIRVYNQITKRNRKIWITRFSVAAACLLGVFITSATLSYLREGNGSREAQVITVQSNAGMRTNFTLPDGTIAYLNSGSTLSYPIPFDKTERRIHLNGEAYFNVTHKADQPFIVSVRNDRMRVHVLGTEFNIQAYDNDSQIKTTLVNGKVNLELKDKNGQIYEEQLAPSEKATFNLADGRVNIERVNPQYETAWIEGRLMFKDSPLPEVLKDLSSFYNVQFDVRDQVIGSYCFTGMFENRQLFQVLDYLKISSNIDYRINQATDDSQGAKRTIVVLWKKK